MKKLTKDKKRIEELEREIVKSSEGLIKMGKFANTSNIHWFKFATWLNDFWCVIAMLSFTFGIFLGLALGLII